MPPLERPLALALLLGTLCAAANAEGAEARVVQRLDYESGNLLQWAAVQALPGRVKIVKSPVRQGRFAARFTLLPGDDPINASGERAEVYAVTGEGEGTESWWRWSTRFPTSFRPNPGSWNIFTQWHNTGVRCAPPLTFEVDNSRRPARLALRVWGGTLDEINCLNSSRRRWAFARLRRSRWYNFVFHVRWSADPSVGFVELWLNGRRVVAKTHTATLYAGQGVYVKQGFYRNTSSVKTVIYHDGLRRFRP